MISIKRMRGTKFIPLIRYLESSEQLEKIIKSSDEELADIFGDDDIVMRFFKQLTLFESEVVLTITQFLCTQIPIINAYFTDKQNLNDEYLTKLKKLDEDQSMLMEYSKKFISNQNHSPFQLPEDPPPSLKSLVEVFYYAIAVFALQEENEEKELELIDSYDKTLKEKWFQTTVFNQTLTILCSLLYAQQTNYNLLTEGTFERKLYKARKITVLRLLYLISKEFKFSLEELASTVLNITKNEWKYWGMHLDQFPSIQEMMKQLEDAERVKEKIYNPIDYPEDYHSAKPVSSMDIQINSFSHLIPFDLETDDEEEMERVMDEVKVFYRDYYDSL